MNSSLRFALLSLPLLLDLGCATYRPYDPSGLKGKYANVVARPGPRLSFAANLKANGVSCDLRGNLLFVSGLVANNYLGDAPPFSYTGTAVGGPQGNRTVTLPFSDDSSINLLDRTPSWWPGTFSTALGATAPTGLLLLVIDTNNATQSWTVRYQLDSNNEVTETTKNDNSGSGSCTCVNEGPGLRCFTGAGGP